MLARVENQYANLKSLIRIENLSRAKFMRIQLCGIFNHS